ncbi:MAG: pyrroloquinoline quinone biosynthesis protein PqqB [Acidobacteria bacterium]|nr:MAG: pyrroloquinoline quinone biosynthesis protein PqqB [Acidobacteriota bacterium]PYX12918.1 MAG: pyrroloquinoline quinone biosynthesis protein PqqB [Acidobacteriota bacterium]
MRIEILGSAAGGGFPQWNCGCRNCQALRTGTFRGKSRTQTQVAITNDGQSWFLLNASPDLRLQIEATLAFRPRKNGRDSPIAGVLLTSGDLDQITGLLSLRELQPFRIYCTASIRRILREDNNIFAMLNRMPQQVDWTDITPGECFCLSTVAGQGSGLHCETFSLPSRYPMYVRQSGGLSPQEASLGLIVGVSSGPRMAYLPAVPELDSSLLERLETVDLLLFDGTFWSDDELIKVLGSGATAREMGHIPVSSEVGSLQKLKALRRPRKIFVHVNNTNPMLDESSPEYREVRAAGWEIAEDGWRFDL